MDLLVRLYDLPPLNEMNNLLKDREVTIRGARSYEKTPVVSWVRTHFGSSWGDECSVSFRNQPVSCHIALKKGEILGFAC
ncbi:MAG: GNAT family N-acetyltransferase, partial [Thermodesulfobacteriota bacterium]